MLSVPSPLPSVSPSSLPSNAAIVFDEGLPFEFTCPKCEQALRGPVRTTCDHYFCRSCIDVENGPVNCLVCQAIVPKGGVTVDKEKQRKIQQLPVRCTFTDNGCDWKGALKGLGIHLGECIHQDAICPICQRPFPMSALEAHQAGCKASSVTCEYCSEKVRNERFQRHMEICPKMVMSCPFQCGLIDSTREEVERHRPSCPNVENVCPFVQMGCDFAGDIVSVQKHLSEEPVRHLVYCCDEVVGQKLAYNMLITDLEALFTRSRELERREMYGAQLIWRIDNIVTKMNEAKSGSRPTIFSAPFMSGRHGYKMVASASLFGDGQSRGQNMSAYVAIVKGEFDGLLEWPFKQIIKITLLDQKPRSDDRIDVVYTVDGGSLADHAHYLSRPTSERNASFGAQAFCSLKKLDEYIKDDTMFIRIDVDVPTEWVDSSTVVRIEKRGIEPTTINETGAQEGAHTNNA